MKKLLKVQLHSHSTRSDGANSPKQMIKSYEKAGYDALAISDHGSSLYNNTQFQNMTDMILFDACEHSRRHHYNIIKGEKETLTIWNHPFRYNDTIKKIERSGKDVVEGTEHGDLFWNKPTGSAKIIENCKMPVVFTDDAHNKTYMLDHAWIWVDSKKCKDDIIRAIKQGNFSIDKREL